MIEVNTTQFRKNLHKLLDHVLESGEPVKIVRKNQVLLIKVENKESKLDALEPHPDFIVGDPEDFTHIDWSKGWKPDI